MACFWGSMNMTTYQSQRRYFSRIYYRLQYPIWPLEYCQFPCTAMQINSRAVHWPRLLDWARNDLFESLCPL